MSAFDEFQEITRLDEPLAPHTWLKVGGPAQIFMEPRTLQELEGVVRAAAEEELPVYILGGGSNLLVRDEGVAGIVVKLKGGEFSRIQIEGTRIRAGGAALLSALISETAQHGLTGLEALVGIPGTVGGAIRGNAGGRHGDIGEHVRSVEALTAKGERVLRQGDELTFGYRFCSLNEPVILEAELELKPGDPDEMTRQMRQVWIAKKATQPFSFQSAGCIFKNPRGLSAGHLIEQAGLKGTRVGGAEVSDRHANFIVTDEQATAADVLKLIEVIRSRVNEVHGVELELEIKLW